MPSARLKNLPIAQVVEAFARLGQPRYRCGQVLTWVYRKRAESFDAMTNMAKPLRRTLAEAFGVEKLGVERTLAAAAGDAVKFVFRLVESADLCESVLLIDRQRRTACVSSQLGCALGCIFCATGTMGFVRNLSQDEVLGQLIGINDYLAAQGDKALTHVVFMGMGEALSNYEVFRSSCEVITAEQGLGLAARRITVSTAGVVPSIRRLAAEGPAVGLAISLNTFSDELRSRSMPINRRYPIAEVLAAAREFAATGRPLTFEYVVMHGENDTPQAVDALARLLRGLACKVNCIPVNPNPSEVGCTPPYEQVLRFVQTLHERGITATARRSRGQDIGGACGQLCTNVRRDKEGAPR